MSRRPRDSQQALPSARVSANSTGIPSMMNNTNIITTSTTTTTTSTATPRPTLGILSGILGNPTNIINSYPSSLHTSVARANPQQQQQQQLLNQLQIQSFINDKSSFQNFDLASLDEAELCTFLSQAIDLLDSPVFLPSQPTHSRFVAALVRCINTMPWGRLFAVATVPANLPIESSKHQQLNNQSTAAPGSFRFKLPSSNRARAYPTNMHDLHAFAKTSRRTLSAMFGLLAIKLANFSPSLIPDILSATLRYFQHLPPSIYTSMSSWYAQDPTLAEGGGGGGGGNINNNTSTSLAIAAASVNHQNVPSSSAPSSCRAYASSLTTWLDNEIDTPMFRVLASLLARYEDYSTQGSIARSHHNNFHGFSSASSSQSSNHGNGTASSSSSPRHVCMSVIEKSIPKKRWPVMAHHLTWFSVMGKFFQIRDVEAMAKAMGELEAAQNTRYVNPPLLNPNSTSSNQQQQQQQHQSSTAASGFGNSTSPTNAASSSHQNAGSLIMRLSGNNSLLSTPSSSQQQQHFNQNNSNNPIGGNASFANLGSAASIQQRAESFIVSEQLSTTILQFMLDGLLNLETLARTSRENSYGARRCASILVDSVVAVGMSKVQKQQKLQQQQQQQQKQAGGTKNNQQKVIVSPSQQPQQQPQNQKNRQPQQQQQKKGQNIPHLQQQQSSSGPEIEDLFPVILRHYLENVIVFSGQSVCCSHSVPIAIAIGLDYVCIHHSGNDDDINNDEEDETGEHNNDERSSASSSHFSCVRTLITSTIARLGKSLAICNHSKLFEKYEQDNNNQNDTHNNSKSGKSSNNSNNNAGSSNSIVKASSSFSNGASRSTAAANNDVHSELLALSHLSSVLKSFTSLLAEQSPEFLHTEVLMKLCFHHPKVIRAEKERSRGRNCGATTLVNTLQDFVALLKKFQANGRRNGDNISNVNNDSETAGVARWLLEDVVKPFCEKFGFDEELIGIFDNNNNGEATEDGGDFNEDAAQHQQKGSNKNNGNKKQTQKKRKFEVLRQPEITKTIWRSYQSFLVELLPISI